MITNTPLSPLFTSTYKTYINHTDAGGIVYHGNYLTFYENCRRDWFTQLGFDGYFITDESDVNETTGNKNNITEGKRVTYHPVVSHAEISYKSPILLDMSIVVTIDVVKIRPASLIFTQSIYDKNMQVLMSKTTMTIACVLNEMDLNTGEKIIKPVRIPSHLVRAIESWQA